MISALVAILKAVLTAVFRVAWLICKIVYRILKSLHIRLLVAYAVICALLSIFLPVFRPPWIAGFWTGLGICAAVTAVSWFLVLRRKLRAPRPVREERKEEKESERAAETAAADAGPSAPQYFDAEGMPGYFFAEYGDRYELYRRTEEGYVHVRTDYKDQGNGERR